ncbi:MAG: IS66 family transposase [Cyanobacteria bacterium]|nr:IS66 family transposase [Cyanobacteriota bacterium]
MWPPEARAFILAQQQEIEQLRSQLTALATELASLRERVGRSSRNSSKPPSSDGPGFKPPERRKGSGRKRGGQPGHPGSGPELLPIERVDEVIDHHPDTCRRCGTLLEGEDSDPLRHQVIDIPPITPLVIEHRLHRLICPCCSTSTCASLPADVDVSRYGPRLSSLIALLGAAFPLSISRSQALLQQVLGVELSRASIVRSLQRISAALEQPTTAAHRALQQQPVVYVDETGAPTGNADGGNPKGKRGWLWAGMSPVVTVFLQGLSRSAAAATELLGHGFSGIVVSDRFSAYNHLPTQQRQLCWAHLIRDLTAISERSGACAEFGDQLLELQQQLFEQWHRYRDGSIDWPVLQQSCRPIRPAVIQRKGSDLPCNSRGVQSANGAICRARLLTVTTTLRQQGRDVWDFLEQAWIAHHHGGVMPSLLPDP